MKDDLRVDIRAQLPIDFKQGTEPDPVEEAKEYRDKQWFVQHVAASTTCYHCKKLSPIIHVRWEPFGKIAFGDPRMLRHGNVRYTDMTRDVQMAFAEHGWKFQKHRSFCPTCKGMGSV